MRALLFALLLAFASGASAQTDPRVYGAWHTTADDPSGADGIAEMWLEFDARGRMFGQATMQDGGETEQASVLMDYIVEGGQIIADGDPASVEFLTDGRMRITDRSIVLEFSRPGAVILGLDVLGLWSIVDDGPARVALFRHNREGMPTITVHLADADVSEPTYQPLDEGTWSVSASGLAMETQTGPVLYTGIRRDGGRITLSTASGESLVLRPLAAEDERDMQERLDTITLEFDAPVASPRPTERAAPIDAP